MSASSRNLALPDPRLGPGSRTRPGPPAPAAAAATMPVPFLGRLHPYVRRPAPTAPTARGTPADARCSYEYLALVGSFALVGLEAAIRVLTLALREWPPPPYPPPPSQPASRAETPAAPFLVELFYRASRRILVRYSSPERQKAEVRRECERGCPCRARPAS